MSRARRQLRAALWRVVDVLVLLARGPARVGLARGLQLALLGCAGSVLCACAPAASGAEQIPAPEVAKFELEAYPVLLRDCGFPACHGARERFFRVFGPGRTRLSPDTSMFAPPTADELAQSYGRARSALANQGNVLTSFLLIKPLAASAGGAEHGGEDHWGRNVYPSADAPGYVTIRNWALSHQKQPQPSAAQ